MNAQFLDQLVAANPSANAAALLALAQADPRTVKPIAGSDFQIWLGQAGRYARLQRTAAAIAASGQPADQGNADLLSSVADYGMSGANFDTTDPTYAGQMAALGTALVGLNGRSASLGLSAAEFVLLIGLGGGYQVADATLADCAAAIVRAGYAALNDLVTADYMANFKTINDLRNGRITKMDAMKAAGAAAPATLAALDVVS